MSTEALDATGGLGSIEHRSEWAPTGDRRLTVQGTREAGRVEVKRAAERRAARDALMQPQRVGDRWRVSIPSLRYCSLAVFASEAEAMDAGRRYLALVSPEAIP